MQLSTNPLTLGLVFAVLLLAGCGLIRPEEGAHETVSGAKPADKPGKPVKPARPSTKSAEKPADKGDPQKRFDAALALLKGNQIQEAEQAFTGITQDFPEFSGPWTNLGIIYAKSNRNSLAITALSKAVSLNPANATAYNWLGILYSQDRDYVRAEKAYQAAIKAKSDFGLAHLNLAILYDEIFKRPADALPHYKEYQRLGGKDDLRVMAWVAEIENPNPQARAKPVEEKP